MSQQAPNAPQGDNATVFKADSIKESAVFKALAVESGIGADLFEQVLYRTGKGFKVQPSRTDYAKLLQVAADLKLSIVLRQIYMIETKQGPQVVIPIDGWLHIMHRHPEYIAHDVVDNYVTVKTKNDAGDVEEFKELHSATFKLWTRKRQSLGLGPYEWTEYMSECYVAPRGGYSGPWQSHPSRMIRHKAASQGVRYELGVYVPTEDEFERAGLLLDEVLRRTEGGEAVPDSRAEPSIPLPTVQRKPVESPFPPAPADLETEPQREAPGVLPTPPNTNAAEERHLPGADPSPDTTQGNASSGGTAASADAGPHGRKAGASSGSPSASPASPEFDAEESRRMDALEAAEQKKRDGLFE